MPLVRVKNDIYTLDELGQRVQQKFFSINEQGARVENDCYALIGGNPNPPPPPDTNWFLRPGAADSIWKQSVGNDLTYLATGTAEHNGIVSAGGVLNYTDWSDVYYQTTTSDPLVSIWEVDVLPSGWNVKDNTYISRVFTTTEFNNNPGLYVKQINSLRCPLNAKWQSVNNTDRKVYLIQPDGYTHVQCHKFQRTSGTTVINGVTQPIIYSTFLNTADARGWALTNGSIMSGIAPFGVIRKWEIAAVLAGDVHAIKHAVRLGLPDGLLKTGPMWPARTQDAQTATRFYYGNTVPGRFLVYDKNVNVLSQGMGLLGQAIAFALQDYGGYVLIRSGNGPVSIQVELSATPLTSAESSLLLAGKNDFNSKIVPKLRVGTNSVPAGGFDSLRVPNIPANIAGGGTRRVIVE